MKSNTTLLFICILFLLFPFFAIGQKPKYDVSESLNVKHL